MNNRIRKLSKDFLYNIMASVIITGVMQLVVYPKLAYNYGEIYGTILTIMGIINSIIITFGNTLNNVRLIMNTEYSQKEEQGDFQTLIIIAGILGSLVCFCISTYLFYLNTLETIILVLTVCFAILKSYYCVAFRINLDFKKTLIQNTVGVIGYLLGVLAQKYFLIWELPFLLAELMQFIYVWNNNDIKKEPIGTTVLLKKTTSKYIMLMISGLSGSVMVYLDRLIIYPSIGSYAVSIYSVASVFGKAVGILMTPIAGVLLGYYSHNSFKANKKTFWTINAVSLFGGICFVVISTFISPYFTKILYPLLFEDAKKYILVANIAATISVVSNLTQSFVLKFSPTWFQIVKEILYGFIYIIISIYLMKKYELIGFCIAAIIANSFKLILLYVVGTISIKEND